jgi:hypothetical protein
MNQKYIVLSEYANLSGIIENPKELYQSFVTGDNTTRKQLLPVTMFERGQEIELDLSKLNDGQLTDLAMKEGCFALVRLNTGYNSEAKKQGFEADLYKVQVGNESKYSNSVMPVGVISQFCQNWEDKKAYILNSQYSRWVLPLIDKFYQEQIIANKKQTK